MTRVALGVLLVIYIGQRGCTDAHGWWNTIRVLWGGRTRGDETAQLLRAGETRGAVQSVM